MKQNRLEGEAPQCLPKHRHAVRRSYRVLIGVLLGSLTLAAIAQPVSDFKYTTNGNAITITGYIGASGNVTIPMTINGLPVKTIGDNAFQTRLGLTSITIPDSVTSIGDYAFSGCTRLTSITIPVSLTSIGDSAFNSCSSLTNIVIPNSVTNIGDYAFKYCSGLTSITIPDSVTNIADYAFLFCTSLSNIVIPNSVASIGDSAFVGCTGLTSITIPDSVTNIGNGAFRGCATLAAITVNPNNAYYSSVDGVLFDQPQTVLITFPEGKGGSYAIPNSVTSIGDNAFQNCFDLTSVTIPNSVTNIRSIAFQGCTSLTSITIPSSVTSIESAAFAVCTNLSGVFFAGNAPAVSLITTSPFSADTNATVYYLPDTTGWGPTFSGRPTAVWNPKLHVRVAGTNGLSLTVAGTADIPILLESATNLVHATWAPLHTCTLTNGLVSFSEPEWATNRVRFYRVRSP